MGRWGGRPPLRREIFYEEEVIKFRPLHDRMVVKRIEAEEKTRGGIIIPDTRQGKASGRRSNRRRARRPDDSGKLIALELKAGDRILFGKWSGTEIKLDDEDLLSSRAPQPLT